MPRRGLNPDWMELPSLFHEQDYEPLREKFARENVALDAQVAKPGGIGRLELYIRKQDAAKTARLLKKYFNVQAPEDTRKLSDTCPACHTQANGVDRCPSCGLNFLPPPDVEAPLLRFILDNLGSEKSWQGTGLPPGWDAGDIVPPEQLDSDPPASPDNSRIQFFGLMERDPGHRLYSMPADTPVAEVVRIFQVGSHGANSYSCDPATTVALVADKATKIADLVPCRVVFADQAGLILRFKRQITGDEVEKIEAMFSNDEMLQAGLERYLAEWAGDAELLAPVLRENAFHFWWD